MEKLSLGENKVIVFYYCIYFILIAILLLVVIFAFSSVTVQVKKFKMDNANTITTIVNHVVEKQYKKIPNYIEIKVIIQLKVFNILPITILVINNKKLKNMIEKKRRKFKIEGKDKELIKAIITDISNNHLLIDNINIDMKLGLNNAYCTALASTVVMIIIAIGLNVITEDRIKIYKNEEKQEKYINKNFKYKVEPVYSEEIVFSLAIGIKITIRILSVIKKLLMYKSNLFVNNTSKYKVKES